jgi:methionyl aminopeptidase
MAIKLKSKNEIKLMRRSGRAAQRLLQELGAAIRPGVKPVELDALARRLLAQAGAKSPFLGHHGYPATITVSVNDAIVHGIPGEIPFAEGDLVSLDVGTIVNGFIGDTAATFGCGQVEAPGERLMRVTREALYKGIEQARAGNRVGDIGYAVQTHVEAHGYTVVRNLVGHGVGREMWEEPQVPNYGEPGKGVRLRPGMVIAIEPMVNAGGEEAEQLDDGWTYVTADGSLSAHFEHSVAILSDGPEILTVVD